MLKKFFISMLGAMAGFWLTLILFGIGLIVFVTMLISNMSGGVKLAKENILYINLEGNIPERQEEIGLNMLLNLEDGTPETLCDILTAIRAAATDPSIKGIYIDCKGSSLGVASRSEIVEALDEFKSSGKFVIAYSDTYDQGDYYVATAADQVYLNPVGNIDVHGLVSSIMFYKGLMDKLDIEAQVVKVGDFKSAVEPFIRTEMSEENKLQTSIFLNQIWKNITTTIAKNRSVDTTAVNMWADSICGTWATEQYVSDKMADATKYRSEVENLLRDKLSLKEDEELPLVKPSEYLSSNSMPKLTKDKHIAVYYAVGDIVDDGKGGIVGNVVVSDILDLAKDDNVKGLILRVNSGGGSAFASEQIWHALEEFKATGKPFYVSMGDYAASGGYYISCGADKIYADASTLTGSIGIFGLLFNGEKLIKEKAGINIDNVATNKNSVFPSLYQAATPDMMEALQRTVNRGYETFTSRVAEGRKISVDSVKVIGGGRVWDGETALSIGLVDEIGSLNKVLNDMAQNLDLSAEDYQCYPSKKEIWEELLSGNNASIDISALGDEAMMAYKASMAIKMIKSLSPVQARMEPITIE